MIKGGYIIQPRSWDNSKAAHFPPVVRELWGFLLRNVNYSDNDICKRGEGYFSLEQIQKALDWKVGYRREMYSKPQLTKSLRRLREESMIETPKATHGVFVKVINYSIYQDSKNYEGNDERSTKETRRKSNGIANKKDEEIQEGKESLREECPEKKTSKLPNAFHSSIHKDEAVNFAKWFRDNLAPKSIMVTDKVLDDWAYQWYLIRTTDKRSDVKEVCDAIQWARGDPFWSNNFLTPMKLRTKDKNGVMFIDRFISEKNKIKNNGKQPEDYSWLMQWIADNPNLK